MEAASNTEIHCDCCMCLCLCVCCQVLASIQEVAPHLSVEAQELHSLLSSPDLQVCTQPSLP